ncbi:MAG: hypothetical protein HY830_19245, partial [Actinobacteria bacterium]|nr:hypothetical protein [Actinomycetota bacterium]
ADVVTRDLAAGCGPWVDPYATLMAVDGSPLSYDFPGVATRSAPLQAVYRERIRRSTVVVLKGAPAGWPLDATTRAALAEQFRVVEARDDVTVLVRVRS